MKDVAPHDRPREKLERLGAAGLGDNELLALVLGSGSRHADALALANRLIEHAGGLHGLTRIGVRRPAPGAGRRAARARRRSSPRSSWDGARSCARPRSARA